MVGDGENPVIVSGSAYVVRRADEYVQDSVMLAGRAVCESKVNLEPFLNRKVLIKG